MDYLNWDLSVIHRAVEYPNLSGAASHVGLSQPQLSRIVSRVESQLGITLLDRDAKRRASWTPAAHRLAEIYSNTCRKFTTDLNGLVQGNQIQHLRIGTLEGLSDLAMELVSHLTTHPAMAKIRVLELNIHDLNELEQAFGKQDLDVIFTSREPGRKKYRHIQTLGYQTIEKVGEEGHAVRVMSSYEYGANSAHLKYLSRSTDEAKILVSNSLEIRKRWLKEHTASGILPSALRQKMKDPETDKPVLLLGSEVLPPLLWNEIIRASPRSPQAVSGSTR